MIDALNTKFAPAYIEAVNVPASASLIVFKLNEPSIHAFGVSMFDDEQDLYDTPYYWAHPVCFAYQPVLENDADPSDSGGMELGGTPDVSPIGLDSYLGISAIYMETIRESGIGENLIPGVLTNPASKTSYQRSYKFELLSAWRSEVGALEIRERPPSHAPVELTVTGAVRDVAEFISNMSTPTLHPTPDFQQPGLSLNK